MAAHVIDTLTPLVELEQIEVITEELEQMFIEQDVLFQLENVS